MWRMLEGEGVSVSGKIINLPHPSVPRPPPPPPPSLLLRSKRVEPNLFYFTLFSIVPFFSYYLLPLNIFYSLHLPTLHSTLWNPRRGRCNSLEMENKHDGGAPPPPASGIPSI